MSSLATFPRTFEDRPVEWLESKTCFYSTEPQCTKLWDQLHIGTLSASKITQRMNQSIYSSTPQEEARQCIGLSHHTLNSDNIDRALIGISGEPVVRDWYSGVIREPIEQVGIAVWKEDPRFRSSIDGKYKKVGIEIKITDRIYRKLIHYMKGLNKGVSNLPPTDYAHIWTSHYNQMIQSMAVTGLESMDYIVTGYKENLVYLEKIYPNPHYWMEKLYKPGVAFLETYVEPLMISHGIKRIDPYQLE